jgi:hypothetical protein
MEPEGSLPHSQAPVSCPYPEPARSSPYPHIPLHLNIILLSEPGSCKWSLSFRFPHQSPLYASSRLHSRYMSCPSTNYITEQKFTAVADTISKGILAGSVYDDWYRVLLTFIIHIHCTNLLSLSFVVIARAFRI